MESKLFQMNFPLNKSFLEYVTINLVGLILDTIDFIKVDVLAIWLLLNYGVRKRSNKYAYPSLEYFFIFFFCFVHFLFINYTIVVQIYKYT